MYLAIKVEIFEDKRARIHQAGCPAHLLTQSKERFMVRVRTGSGTVNVANEGEQSGKIRSQRHHQIIWERRGADREHRRAEVSDEKRREAGREAKAKVRGE